MLTQRKQKILKSIIGEYISTAVPVGSEKLVQKHQLGVSSATVRNEMAELEAEGYITRLYPSAGGMPSDKGYRWYVESLEIPELPPAVKFTLRHCFDQVDRDLEVWTRLAASLLAQLVRNLTLVTLPSSHPCRLKYLQLIRLQEFLALLILVLQEARLRKELLPLRTPLTQEELTMVANKLNESYAGLGQRSIASKQVELTPFEEEVKERLIYLMKREDEEAYRRHYMDGLRHLLSQPEFAGPDRAREVVEAVEEETLIRSVLSQAPEGGVRVVIGKENPVDRLYPFSLVLAQYSLPEGAFGTIGVIGPTRLHYGLTIAAVRFLALVLEELMAEVS